MPPPAPRQGRARWVTATARAAVCAAILVTATPLQAETPSVVELCRQWDALEKKVRDRKISPEEAQRQIAAIHAALSGALEDAIPGAPLVFPLAGCTAKNIGGKEGKGYVASRYDFYDSERRSGHPAQDIFIDDDNEDTVDDRTGKKVRVLSATAGVVTAVETEWPPSSELRGGKYVWVFSPALARYCYYAHLDSVAVKTGDAVPAGGVLGLVGRTGKNAAKRRSPTHLHMMCLSFENGRLRPRNMYKDLRNAQFMPDDDDRADYRWVGGGFGRRVREIAAPQGFARTAEAQGSFGAWLRGLPMKAGGDVIDAGAAGGSVSGAALVMRLRGEHLYARRLAARIRFRIAPGLDAAYIEWLEGFRIKVGADMVGWLQGAKPPAPPDYGYGPFHAYLGAIAANAGPALLDGVMAKPPDINDIRAGDVLMNPGAPGVAVIVLDTAIDRGGKRKMLLAFAGARDRDLRLLVNQATQTPWFDADGMTTVPTPGWTFTAGDLLRFTE